MSTVTLRPVTADDHAAWLSLWQPYLTFYETVLPDEVTVSTWQRLLDPEEPMHAALAWVDGQAVGMVNWVFHRTCWSIGNGCYLQDLFVDPNQRGLGIGRALIEHVCSVSKDAGCSKVHWLTQHTNATAIRLYEQVAQRSGFIQFRRML